MKTKHLILSGAIVLVAGVGAGAAIASTQSNEPRESGTQVDAQGVQDFVDALPPTQGVALPDGRIGYADSHALHATHPVAQPGSSEIEQWLRELIPVTAQEDPSSELLGYYIRGGVGFVDRATAEAPSFDVDALLLQAEERNARDADAIANQVGPR